jgi:hypothetical protein
MIWNFFFLRRRKSPIYLEFFQKAVENGEENAQLFQGFFPFCFLCSVFFSTVFTGPITTTVNYITYNNGSQRSSCPRKGRAVS